MEPLTRTPETYDSLAECWPSLPELPDSMSIIARVTQHLLKLLPYLQLHTLSRSSVSVSRRWSCLKLAPHALCRYGSQQLSLLHWLRLFPGLPGLSGHS